MPTAPGQVRLDDLVRVCSSEGRLNPELLQEMLHLFIRENGRRVRSAVAAAKRGDHDTFRADVHAVRGSAALIGAESLRDLASDMELRILGGTIKNVLASARLLRDEYDAVVSTLRTLYPELCTD